LEGRDKPNDSHVVNGQSTKPDRDSLFHPLAFRDCFNMAILPRAIQAADFVHLEPVSSTAGYLARL
jgi:hypothetical protein